MMDCEHCEHYDQEEHYCTYIICAPGYCDEPFIKELKPGLKEEYMKKIGRE